MARNFTAEQLRYLRNGVPISELIENHIAVPSKHIGGKLRHECPKCGDFDTSIYAEHNILKCFNCQKRFNPIDMAMNCVMENDFVKSGKWLLKHYPMIGNKASNREPRIPKRRQPADKKIMPPPDLETDGAVHIKHVMKHIVDTLSDSGEPEEKSVAERVADLETKVSQILENISEIKNSVRILSS